MNNQPLSLSQGAMRYGTYMGLFWVVKFLLLLAGLHSGSIGMIALACFVFFGATVAVPVVAYFMARAYRTQYCGGYIHFTSVWVFTTFLYIFASLFAAAGHYIYFQFFDQGFFFDLYFHYMETSGMSKDPEVRPLLEQLQQLLPTLTPIKLVVQFLSSNILYGAMQSVVIALFVARRPRPVSGLRP